MDINAIVKQLSEGRTVDQRREAAMFLTRVSEKSIIKPLISSLSDHEDIVIFSTLALVNIGKQAIPDLISALRDSADKKVKSACAEILGEINDNEALPTLIEILHKTEDIQIKQSIVEALGRYKSDLALAELHRLLNEKEPLIVTFAALALHRNGQNEDLYKYLVNLLKESQGKNLAILSWGLVEICGRSKIPYLKKIADNSGREDVKDLLDEIIHGISIKYQN